MYDKDFMDAMAITSFIVGIANYKENLTQSDKDEIMDRLDRQTKDILERIENDLDEQNAMLREILKKIG